MTTPNNFMNRYLPINYSPMNALWTFAPQNLLNPSPNFQFPVFPNQLPYHFTMPPQSLYNHHQPFSYHHSLPHVNSRVRPGGLNCLAASVDGGVQNKFQKSKRGGQQSKVILISDDQEVVQQEKEGQDKIALVSSKSTDYNGTVNSKIIYNSKSEQNQQNKTQQKQKKLLIQKSQQRPLKTKDIVKPTVHHKKYKTKIHDPTLELKKGQIFSQRIIQKQEIKKQPFRLSKRQRELLQVSYLRELSNGMILTGPQFQAKLPKFLGGSEEVKQWRAEIRTELLCRRYKEQQQ